MDKPEKPLTCKPLSLTLYVISLTFVISYYDLTYQRDQDVGIGVHRWIYTWGHCFLGFVNKGIAIIFLCVFNFLIFFGE